MSDREGYCECCDLPTYSCGKDRETRLREVGRRADQWISASIAKFPGTCARCGEWYEAGSEITPDAQGWRNLGCCI